MSCIPWEEAGYAILTLDLVTCSIESGGVGQMCVGEECFSSTFPTGGTDEFPISDPYDPDNCGIEM